MTAAPETNDLHRTAADWFARKRSGAMTTDETRALEAWLAADPEHHAALDSVELMWAASGAIRSDPAVLAIREEALQTQRPRWRLVAAGGAMAASLAALVVGGAFLTGRPDMLALGPRTFSTSPGQTSTISLPDGSKVTLDADTVLRTRETADRRSLELVRGRAFFRVAKDPKRPFVVAARNKTVTAIGTAFDVSLEPHGVQVTLLEGKVKVDAPVAAAPLAAPRVQSTEMSAGSRLVAPDNGSWRVAKVDASQEVSWAAGQLVFAGKSLAQVAEE
ncbi:MAG TPA: FecR domain-containing protein, partial [Caulobacteraceae bacterium]|nr:FecR domain-containing protein [Caulobacteraceae bacterium]